MGALLTFSTNYRLKSFIQTLTQHFLYTETTPRNLTISKTPLTLQAKFSTIIQHLKYINTKFRESHVPEGDRAFKPKKGLSNPKCPRMTGGARREMPNFLAIALAGTSNMPRINGHWDGGCVSGVYRW